MDLVLEHITIADSCQQLALTEWQLVNYHVNAEASSTPYHTHYIN